MQEAMQKDVERAFGVLQARFAIVAHPARGWSTRRLNVIMKACIILHNMIVEDERDTEEDLDYEQVSSAVQPSRSSSCEFSSFVRNYQQLRDENTHHQLRNDLIAHLWARKGKSVS